MRTANNELKYLFDHKAQFKRLGYLSLNSNERSQFQARELKSVYIDHKARFLKIKLHKCHINKYNLVNQVGLIAINVLGEQVVSALNLKPGFVEQEASVFNAEESLVEANNRLLDAQAGL